MNLFNRCYILLVFFVTCITAASAQQRIAYTINDGWKFLPSGSAYAETVSADDNSWQTVSLPHTWNAEDVFDDDRTYRRGISWYRKSLVLDQQFKNRKVYLYFEGANQVTHVYVNGSFAGMHKGGYTGFSIDITDYLQWKNNSSKNTIAVQVNNAHDPFVPPLNVGYASYGGIYRDVWLISTDPIHFDEINNNSGGVRITTPMMPKDKFGINVGTTVINDSKTARTCRVVSTLFDREGKKVTSFMKTVDVFPGEKTPVLFSSNSIPSPHLWSPEDPYLYRMETAILMDMDSLDKVVNTIGFRWFSFNDSTGFALNGRKLVLHGTNRHQDMKGKGDALTMDDHRRDMQLIKDMGCNFVRLAHYPQAAQILNLADELGLLVWEEVPVVNFVTRHPEFVINTNNMIHEMISQGFNHPSVIMWGSSNEILLHGPDGERIGRQNDSAYIKEVRKYFQQFDSTVKAEDPTRYSTVAMHISGDYSKYGYDTVSQVAGYNIYSGWYSGKAEDFGNDLDRRKKKGHVVFVSEYGAEGEVRLNTEKPIRMDYTGQYQRYYHEMYLRQINARPWLAGTAIWNEFDFSQPNIGGPEPHMNQKGVVTFDRKPKDSYFFYKANWNPQPGVYIASTDWKRRAGEANAMSTIDVYSNIDVITLFVNGVAQGSKKTDDVKKASWQVKLQDGENVISASGKIKGKTFSDQLVIKYNTYNSDLKKSPFKSIAVNAGSNAQYVDPAGTVWIEDRPYTAGSFGYTSGKPRFFDRKDPIRLTDDEPMYYTLLDSIGSYKFDVTDGNYSVTLCFAEPDKLKAGDRVFDVKMNDAVVMNDVDLVSNYGFATATRKTFTVTAKNNTGITVSFISKKGVAVLNGIRIDKNY